MTRVVKVAGALSLALVCQLAAASSPVLTGAFAGADGADTVASNPAGMSRLAEGAHKEVELTTLLSFDEFKVDESKTTKNGGDPDSELSPQAIPAGYYVNSSLDIHVGASSFSCVRKREKYFMQTCRNA